MQQSQSVIVFYHSSYDIHACPCAHRPTCTIIQTLGQIMNIQLTEQFTTGVHISLNTYLGN